MLGSDATLTSGQAGTGASATTLVLTCLLHKSRLRYTCLFKTSLRGRHPGTLTRAAICGLPPIRKVKTLNVFEFLPLLLICLQSRSYGLTLRF